MNKDFRPTPSMATPSTEDASRSATVAYETLLPAVVVAVRAAGAHLLERFSQAVPPQSHASLVAAIQANDQASLGLLREALQTARPQAGWVEDELGTGALPPGEWWITDPVEGNINHIHGMPGWGVSATLIRDNIPVLTVIDVPLSGETYTALRHGGAFVNGMPLRASAKGDLKAALVATGQAMPGEDADTYRRIGQSVTAMLSAALVVRVTVPATFQLAQVASGQMDAFWQYSQVRSGQVSGALLVQEAGGMVTDIGGAPWSMVSKDFLASASGLHAAVSTALSVVA